jgi:hypothetical protein
MGALSGLINDINWLLIRHNACFMRRLDKAKGIGVQSLRNIFYFQYEREGEAMLQKAKGMVVLGSVLAMAIFLMSGMAFAGDTVSLVGEINDDFQIVTDNGETYEVMMSDQGIDLIDHAGERVRVTGEIIEEGEDRVIDVLSYEVLTAEIKAGQEEEIEESDEKSVQDKQ